MNRERPLIWPLPVMAAACLAAASFGSAYPRLGSPPQNRAESTDSAETAEFFESKVRPVLADKCFSCHPEKSGLAKGGLKLDSREGILKGGVHGGALAPGDPEHSLLVRAVGFTDKNLRMPPSGRLKESEILALTAWVRSGAPWAKGASKKAPSASSGSRFWAFIPPAEPPIPRVSNPAWAQNPIDRLVMAGLESKKLKRAPCADRRTLIRRATFDLTGLPPTSTEIADFLADTRPGAFACVVDRLLASPAYGERWGRHWLDVARYADSNGVDENLVYTQAWRYRDYVIRAFNQDKPIDRFIQEQIAGDLLPPSSDGDADYDRVIATGYLSLGPKMLAEDDPVKQEMDVIDEQIDTLGKTFMGLTLGCARCHDHKFDPLPQTDYYALAGIFKSTKTMLNYKNMAEWQEVPLAPKTVQDNAAAIDRAIQEKRAARDALVKKNVDEILAEAKGKAEMYRLAAQQALQGEGRGITRRAAITSPDGSVPAGAIVVEAEEFARGNVLKDRDGYGKGIGVLVNAGQYPNRTEYDVEIPEAGAYQLDLRYASGDPRAIRIYVNDALVTANAAGRVTGGFYPGDQKWFAEGIFAFRFGKNVIRFERDSYFPHIDKLLLIARRAAPITRTPEQLAADSGLNAEFLAQIVARHRQAKPGERVAVEFALPDKPERLFSPAAQLEIRNLDDSIAAFVKTKPNLPRAMAVTEGKPTDLKVHLRGDYLTLGASCSRGFPKVLVTGSEPPSIPPDHSGRLELARWITNPHHPLTARVFVNRVWRWHFGKGLVASTDNFGTLGDRPVNQPLLDWLATTFVTDAWSLKKLHRRIMLTNTYQMSSRYDARASEIDPENRLHWRSDRRRLEVEAIRDSLLALSGQLDRKLGGTLLAFKDREYVTSTANSDPVNYRSSRRSVYLPVIRSALYDVYTAFDFGDPTVMNGDRPTTTVAPQALFMMNSSLVLEQTKAMAARLLALKELDDAGRFRRAYEDCYGRLPTAPETARTLSYIDRFDAAYRPMEPDQEKRRQRVWQSICKTLVAASDFIYVD